MRWVRRQMTDETRRGEEKRDFFRKSLSDFSFFADIPNVRNRSRTAEDTKKWRFFLRISIGFRVHPQIYPVCETSRRAVGGVKSDDFFENLYRIAEKFADIHCVQRWQPGRSSRVEMKKARFFLRKYRQFSCLFPDIPCVRNQSQCGHRREK